MSGDFEVWVDAPTVPPPEGQKPVFPVKVFSSPAGTANGELKLDLTDPVFAVELVQVTSIDPDLQVRKAFGGRLFDALFAQDVRDAWRASWGRVDAHEFDGLRLRLIVLNACHSAQAETGGIFAGVGPSLARKRMPAVIAMQYPSVQLDTAGAFSRAFYRALANGLPVDAAVDEARQLLATRDLGDRDWSTPVLYTGTRNGRILNFENRNDQEVEQSWRSLQDAARRDGTLASLSELQRVRSQSPFAISSRT